MTPTTLFVIDCKAPGCRFHGHPDMVCDHTDGRMWLVCPRCRSKNVKTVEVTAPTGERLGRIRLFGRLTKGL